MTPDALVCGSGPDLWKDLESARRAAPKADLIGVNLTGLYLATVQHLVSLHPALPGPLRALRASCDWCRDDPLTPPVTHSRRAHEGVDRVWELPPQGRAGTSSLFAVHVALGLGYARVILAGVPMDSSGRFFDPPGATVWPHDKDDRAAWEVAAREWFGGRVRSVGGWTAGLVGEP